MLLFISFLCIGAFFIALLVITNAVSTPSSPVVSDDLRAIKAADDSWSALVDMLEDAGDEQRVTNESRRNRNLKKKIEVAEERQKLNKRLAALSSESSATTNLVKL